jgi:hypothetical protein
MEKRSAKNAAAARRYVQIRFVLMAFSSALKPGKRLKGFGQSAPADLVAVAGSLPQLLSI